MDKKSRSYRPPSYHHQGFGRKNTKPSWYDVRVCDKTRRPLEIWEGDACGHPLVIPKVADGRAPFIHDSDKRVYRPTVQANKRSFSLEVEAGASNRSIVSRGEKRNGKNELNGTSNKYGRYQAAAQRSKMQMLCNQKASSSTEMQDLIFGNARPMNKPLLYPQNVTHNMMLAMEKRLGQTLPYDERPPSDHSPFERQTQHMYLPFSRTRADFQHAKKIEQPSQTP